MPDFATSSDPRWEHNLQSVRNWEEPAWSTWFLGACASDPRERNYAPLRLHPNARLTAEVDVLYGLLTERSRSEMRKGILQALRIWNADHYGYTTLEQLCSIVASIQAANAIPTLLRILRDHREVLMTTEQLAVADTLIYVVGGFVPDRAVESVFAELLFEYDQTPPELASLLAVGISASNPARFAECFNRFVVVRSRIEEFFGDEHVITAFAEAVSAEDIHQSVASLSWAAVQYWITAGLSAGVVSRADIMSVDTEGRQDIKDRFIPLQEGDEFDQYQSRYAIAVNAAVGEIETVNVELSQDQIIVNSLYYDADGLPDLEEDAA